jgi:hypothetical protein
MQRIELEQLLLDEQDGLKSTIDYLLAIGIREHKATQHQEKSHATITPELKALSNQVEQHDEQDEQKTE